MDPRFQMPTAEEIEAAFAVPSQDLFNAAKTGRLSAIRDLVERHGEDAVRRYAGVCLMEAADNGHLAVVRYIATEFKHTLDEQEVGRALCYAVDEDRAEIVQFMLDAFKPLPFDCHLGEILCEYAKAGNEVAFRTVMESMDRTNWTSSELKSALEDLARCDDLSDALRAVVEEYLEYRE